MSAANGSVPGLLRVLPTEVELAVRVQPCLAERRTYERADRPHPCEFFADQGTFHAYDLSAPSAPPTPTTLQPVRYAGRRRLVPELLAGCRKAPIMAVGINPNLPAFWPGKHNALQPLFDDLLQYVHHYRYRAIGKLEIEPGAYEAMLGGRRDEPAGGPELAPVGAELPVRLANQAMYEAYQALLDGLAQAAGWAGARLAVGEDLSYGNMVACGSPRWITQPDPRHPGLPVMTPRQREGIVDECFVKRRYFLRQLFQSLPRVLLVFGGATRDAIAAAMAGHFLEGAPRAGEDMAALLGRRIVLRYGRLPSGEELRARVIFVPHASGNPDGFAAAKERVIAALLEEVRAGALALDAASGHLARAAGACAFCDNALYRIGACDYADQLRPLAGPLEEAAEEGAVEGAERSAAVRERRVQETLLDRWLAAQADAARGGASASAASAEAAAITGAEEAAEEGATAARDAAPAPARRLALRGRIVTMDRRRAVIDDGVVYARGGKIEDVRGAADPAPAGFANVPVVATGGTIYPGLIDLHNHLAYNALPPWAVPRRYDDRSQWRRAREYAARIGLMQRLRAGDPARAVARYVEAKALLGGVTTLQGMRSSFAPVSGAMRGLVRNVELGGAGMPRAGSSVMDLDVRRPEQVERFRAAVGSDAAAYFYHLCEGTNDATRKLWADLADGALLGPGLVGIHCLGVPRAGLRRLADAGASVVWSPTSNLMLYGQTLQLAPLLESGVTWVLGCDWSPTGGKNPLFELKVARAVARAQGVELPARDLVAAVTSRAAAAVRWQGAIGQIAPGLRADLLVLAGPGDGAAGDPYEQLIAAVESDVALVVIDGVVRAGTAALFAAAGVPGPGRESVQVGGREQLLWLADPGTPLDGYRLDRAAAVLTRRMTRRADEEGGEEAAEAAAADDAGGFELVLDDEMAPLPPPPGGEEAAEAIAPIPQQPDALTVLGDAALWKALRAIEHFPLDVDALEDFYR